MTEGCWYLTELIYRIHDNESPTLFQFDKQMRLIKAESAREAYQNALVMASHELDKRNLQPQSTIQWEFVGIALLEAMSTQVDNGIDKAELYYTIETAGAAEEYLQALRQKNALLQTQIALSA